MKNYNSAVDEPEFNIIREKLVSPASPRPAVTGRTSIWRESWTKSWKHVTVSWTTKYPR